ncbi:Gfo/Idh/MocA family oxidoreductase [bacterium]|nr:Gfo/Idh/MocA family oxidoreductase [bacterium]
MTTFRWGILGTGFVAKKFALGLGALPDTEVTAVASRSLDNAKGFAAGLGPSVRAITYEDLVQQPDVDGVYIATPPALHSEHALLAINAGKAVLIEKPFCADAAEARALAAAAKEKNVFCMEAMWTRFTPVVRRAKAMIDNGDLGAIRLLTGNFCLTEMESEENHLFRSDLGGGALLDRGVYLLSLAIYYLGVPSSVTGSSVIGTSGVDVQSSMSLVWNRPDDRYPCVGHFHASLVSDAVNDFHIAGDKAKLHIPGPVYRPSLLKYSAVSQSEKLATRALSKKDRVKENHWTHQVVQRAMPLLSAFGMRGSKKIRLPYGGNAYQYQAQEVAECVAAGKIESDIMPLDHSVAVLEIIGQLRAGRS